MTRRLLNLLTALSLVLCLIAATLRAHQSWEMHQLIARLGQGRNVHIHDAGQAPIPMLVFIGCTAILPAWRAAHALRTRLARQRQRPGFEVSPILQAVKTQRNVR